jgi:hypothetical protein
MSYADCRYAGMLGVVAPLDCLTILAGFTQILDLARKKLFSDKRSSLIFRSVFDEGKKCFFKPLLGHGKILLSLFFLFLESWTSWTGRNTWCQFHKTFFGIIYAAIVVLH